jgi:hypothetical protein
VHGKEPLRREKSLQPLQGEEPLQSLRCKKENVRAFFLRFYDVTRRPPFGGRFPCIKGIETAGELRYSPPHGSASKTIENAPDRAVCAASSAHGVFRDAERGFIHAPSIGWYRIAYMEERIAAAHLASLALEAPSSDRVSTELLEELLKSAKSYGVVLRRPESRVLMLSRNMPPKVYATFDTRDKEYSLR